MATDKDRNIDAVVIAGDLFDRPDPDREDWDLVRSGIERLAEMETPVILLPGVYDGIFFPESIYHRDTVPRGLSIVTGSEPEVFSFVLGEQTLSFCSVAPYPGNDRPELIPSAEKGSGIRVGLYHGQGETDPGCPGWLPEIDPGLLGEDKLDLIVLGGPHNFREDQWGSTPVVSPGTPVGLRPGEWEDRVWVIAEMVEGRTRIQCEKRKVGVIRDLHIDLEKKSFKDEKELRAFLHEEYGEGTGMIDLDLSGEVEGIWSDRILEKELSTLPFPVRITNRTILALDRGTVSELQSQDTVEARFARELQSRISDVADPAKEKILDGAMRRGLQEFQNVGEHHED